MSSLLFAALATSLLSQTPAPAPVPATEPTEAEILAAAGQMMASLEQMFVLMGTCENAFPPEVSQAFTQSFSPAALAGKTEEERAVAATFNTAYETGRTSPRAATITLEQCTAEIEALGASMQAMGEEIGAKASSQD